MRSGRVPRTVPIVKNHSRQETLRELARAAVILEKARLKLPSVRRRERIRIDAAIEQINRAQKSLLDAHLREEETK